MEKKDKHCINVAVADDHELFRIGMRYLFGEISGVNFLFDASNGKELLDMLGDSLPDIIFMDVCMPIMDGIEATAYIRSHYPSIKIVVLTSYDDRGNFEKMVKLGVNGFMLKSATALEIRTAIVQVIKGLTFISNDLFDLISKIVVSKKETVNTCLSKREKEILELIYLGMETRAIAEKLFVSQRTIEKHKSSMMAKTNTKNTVQLLIFAIKNKFIEANICLL